MFSVANSAAGRELVFVLILLSVLLIAGVVGVFIFIRQWRREHRQTVKGRDKGH